VLQNNDFICHVFCNARFAPIKSAVSVSFIERKRGCFRARLWGVATVLDKSRAEVARKHVARVQVSLSYLSRL